MRIFLTGGSGDLGKVLAFPLWKNQKDCVRFDVRKPSDSYGHLLKGPF